MGDLVKKEEKTVTVTVQEGSKKSSRRVTFVLTIPHTTVKRRIWLMMFVQSKLSEKQLYLKVMRRRLVEKLSIYTYVGDIVLCMNPYMYLPKMVDIAEYPNHLQFKLGENPHSYASAHFAYWGALKPEMYPGSTREKSELCCER